MIRNILFFALLLIITAGCQRDVPEPEVRVNVVPMRYVSAGGELPVTATANKGPFDVQYHVKGDKVFVECMLPNITFQDNRKNTGKIILYVNGQKKNELNTAAFIVKGLPSGEHHIRLEVVDRTGGTYNLSKEFNVNIP